MPFGDQLGSGWGREGFGTIAGAGPLVSPTANDAAVGPHVDLDLLGVFGVTAEKQRLATAGAGRLLRRQVAEFLASRQSGIIAALRSGVLRLLAPIATGLLGAVLRVIQVIGAIVARLGFGASSEEIGLKLAFLTFELFDLLLQRRDAVEGITMTRLPISNLLTEFEVLALQAIDFGV
jgi:hypothetical protein